MVDFVVDAGVPCKPSPMCVSGSRSDVQWTFDPPVPWASVVDMDGAFHLCMNAPTNLAGTEVQSTLTRSSCFVDGVPTSVDSVDLNIQIEETFQTYKADMSAFPEGFNTTEYFGRNPRLNGYERQRYTDDQLDSGSDWSPVGGGVTPLGYNPFSTNGVDEFTITARPMTAAEIQQIADVQNLPVAQIVQDWFSGALAQKHGEGQIGGVFRQCVKADAIDGQFFGGWLNQKFATREWDVFELGIKSNNFTGSPTHTDHNWAFHDYPDTTYDETQTDGSVLTKVPYDGGDTDSGVHDIPCLTSDDRCICHEIRFKPSDQFDNNGCRLWEVCFITECVVKGRMFVSSLSELRHIFTLAVSTGFDVYYGTDAWVPGVSDDTTQIQATICCIETRQYADVPTLPTGTTEPQLTNVDPNASVPPYATNFTTSSFSAGLTYPVVPGNVPGWSFVQRDVRIGGFSLGDQAAYTSGMNGIYSGTKMIFVTEVWRDPATGTCIELISDGIYLNP